MSVGFHLLVENLSSWPRGKCLAIPVWENAACGTKPEWI